MPKVYLMVEDLPTGAEDEVSLGWAVDWGTDDGLRPEVLSDAQETLAKFLGVLERIPWARKGEKGRIILLGDLA